MYFSFADRYDKSRALVSLTGFQTAEYDGLSLSAASPVAGFVYSKIIFP
jgi:hypothetical protein